MRKLWVALVICLLLAFFMGAQPVSALKAPTMINPGNIFDLSKSKAELKNIEKKLMTGNPDIAIPKKILDFNAKQMANKIYTDTSAGMKNAAKMNNTTVKAPRSTITKPKTDLQGKAKSLEHIDLKVPSINKMFVAVL